MRTRKLLGAMAAALALLAVASIIVSRPASGIGSGSLFTVAKGDTMTAVANTLKEKGLIRSTLVFRLLAKVRNTGSLLKAGIYRVETGMGANRILDVLASGKQASVRFSVPEGLALTQLASLLERLGVVGKKDFQETARNPALLAELGIPALSAEGYLFPDTYVVPAGCSAEAVVRLMVKAFRDRAAAIPEAAGLSASELHDTVILASMVECEYRVPEEAPVIAGVFRNRLKAAMPLQSCATIVYIITERLGKPHPELVYARDLEIHDPYNTYENRGLPPGPISNPGMTSLRAAFSSTSTRFLYFRLLNPRDGTHHFSTTLEGHNDAQSLFVKNIGG